MTRRRSFVNSVLGRPSRSYAKEAVSPWADEPSYPSGGLSLQQLDLHDLQMGAAPRRAGSLLNFGGPTRSSLASPPASDVGVSNPYRRRPRKASSDIGYQSTLPSYSIFHVDRRRPIIEDERETASEYSEVSEACQQIPPAVVNRQSLRAKPQSQPPPKPKVRHTHFADKVEYMDEVSRESSPLRKDSNSSSASSDTPSSAIMSPTTSVTVAGKPLDSERKMSPLGEGHRDGHNIANTTVPMKPIKEVRFEAPPTPPAAPAPNLAPVISDVSAAESHESSPRALPEPSVSQSSASIAPQAVSVPAPPADGFPKSPHHTTGSVDSHDNYYTPRSSLESTHSDSTNSDAATPIAQYAEMPLPVFQVQPPTPNASSETPERNGPDGYLAAHPAPRDHALQEDDFIEEESDTETEGDSDEEEGNRGIHEIRSFNTPSTYDVASMPTGPVRPPLPRKSSKRPAVKKADEPPTPPPKPKLNRNPSSSSTISRGGRVTGATITILNERPNSRSGGRPTLTRSASSKSDTTITRSKSSQSARKKERPPKLALHPRFDPSPPSSRPLSRASTVSHYSQNSDQTSTSRPKLGSEMSYGSSVSQASQRSVQSNGSIPGSQTSRGVNGKGGWAAASATPVVMYMPSGGNDGWAAFQPLPPRSRATPLPGSHKAYERTSPLVSAASPSVSAASSSVGGSAGDSVRGSAEISPSYNNYAGPLYVSNGIPHSASMPLPRELSPSDTPTASPMSAEFPINGRAIVSPSPIRLPQMTGPPEPPAPVQQQPVPPPVVDQESDSDSDSDDSMEKPSRSYVNTPPGSLPSERRNGTAVAHSISSPTFGGINRERRRSLPSTSSFTSTTSNRSARKSWMPPGPVPPVPPIPASIASTLSRPSAPPSVVSDGPDFSRPLSPMTRASLDRPSTLNPDVLTMLPEMSVEDSNTLYNFGKHHRKTTSEVGSVSRRSSFFGRNPRQPKASKALSDIGHHRTTSEVGFDTRAAKTEVPAGYARSDGGNSIIGRPFSPAHSLRRAEDGTIDLNGWDTVSNAADMTVMESHGRDQNVTNGYTSLVLPRGGSYKPEDPMKAADTLDPRILGMPTGAMAAITFTSSAYLKARKSKEAPTPQHLQQFLPSPVDFSSHLQPPTKVAKHQILLQVYAVAVDAVDLKACDSKGDADVGKWIPGRSFVGRAVTVGTDETEIYRGDMVMGLVDVRKSGALAEYMVVERRRVARVPPGTHLSLEQLAVLPSQGISAFRALQGCLTGVRSALIMDAHLGIPALFCQQMRRQGISVTAVIPGGDEHADAQTQAYENGARGCMTGLPSQVMNSLEEGLFDIVVDTRGGDKTYNAAVRVLAEGGLIISLAGPAPEHARSVQRKGVFKRMFSRSARPPRFEEIRPAGDGEAEVDLSGQDTRDVLEQQTVSMYRPAVGAIVPFEKGPDLFVYKPGTEEKLRANVVRIIN